jgi:predicted amidohydrolase
MSIPPTHDEFEATARRFMRQAQAKAAQLTVFPELTGVMLAPPLISGFKRSFIQRDDQGKHPTAGIFSRGMGRLAGTTGGAVGGGFRGSLERLLRKRSDELRDAYVEIFGRLAREYSTNIVAGSLYLYDEETESVKNRSYLFDVAGEVVGYQDKLNLTADEQGLASPGSTLNVLETRYGRLGIVLGLDALYPEVSRLLAMRGADILVGITASPGAAPAMALRSALATRAEENQVFVACSFLLGPNYLGRENREDLYGQSALLAPISLTRKGDGILLQAGTDRTETLIAGELPAAELYTLRESGRFRPRQQLWLGELGPVLADFYEQGLTIEQVIERDLAPAEEMAVEEEALLEPVEDEALFAPSEEEAQLEPIVEEAPAFAPVTLEPEEEDEEPEPDAVYPSVAEVLSLTGEEGPEE